MALDTLKCNYLTPLSFKGLTPISLSGVLAFSVEIFIMHF